MELSEVVLKMKVAQDEAKALEERIRGAQNILQQLAQQQKQVVEQIQVLFNKAVELASPPPKPELVSPKEA